MPQKNSKEAEAARLPPGPAERNPASNNLPPDKRGPGRPIQPGEVRNPGGRPSTRALREWLGEVTDPTTGMTRRLMLLNSTFLTAMDRGKPEHMKAKELLLAYDWGRPVDAVELSGPDGGDIPVGDAITALLARLAGAKADAEDEE